MKDKKGYVVIILLSIFAILFIIVYIEIYVLEPTSWYNSESIIILLILALVFGGSGFLLIFIDRIKEFFDISEKATCTKCGNRNRISALHCDKCGKEL